jgi:branched-chain amino acid transport system substrate-binding protein
MHRATVAVLALVVTGACGSQLDERQHEAAALQSVRAVIGPAAERGTESNPVNSHESGAALPADTPAASRPRIPVADATGTGSTPNSPAGAAASPTSPTISPAAGGTKTRAAPATTASPGNVGRHSTAVPPNPTAPGGPKGEIRLGSVGTESGPGGGIFLGGLHGAKAWVADVNGRGGLAGHPVHLITVDDGGDPSRAFAGAKRLVESDKVQAFFATRSIFTEQAYAPYLEERRIPIISTCGCNPVDGPSPMTFDGYINPNAGGVWMHMGPILTETDKRKIALFYCREAPICQIVRDNVMKAQKELGYTVAFEAQVSIAQPDYTAEVIAARNAGADAVASVMDNASTLRIARSMSRQGWTAPYSSQFSNHDERVLKNGGRDVEGFLISGATAPWSSSALMADYRAAVDRYVNGGVKSDFGAGAWVGGKLMEKIAPGFPEGVTNEDFLRGLYGLKEETLGGRIAPTTFAQGSHDRTNLCMFPIVVKNAAFVAPHGDKFFCAPGWKPGG